MITRDLGDPTLDFGDLLCLVYWLCSCQSKLDLDDSTPHLSESTQDLVTASKIFESTADLGDHSGFG